MPFTVRTNVFSTNDNGTFELKDAGGTPLVEAKGSISGKKNADGSYSKSMPVKLKFWNAAADKLVGGFQHKDRIEITEGYPVVENWTASDGTEVQRLAINIEDFEPVTR